jgi:hypothetical protein
MIFFQLVRTFKHEKVRIHQALKTGSPKSLSMADSKDKPLESYIHLSYHLGANCFTRDKRIFDHGLSHMPPFLRSSRKNRLLLYPGSFNPPHYGHLNLLCDAFQRSQYDIIAAIVLPLDDDRLEKKCGEQRKEMVLSKKQRVDLWRGEHWPNDWFWVYDRTESEWNRFRRVLTENITRDGFELDFVLLCGPDYVQTHSLPPPMPWGCRDIIVSDAGRPADFNRMVALDTLENCGPWKVITLSDDAGLQNAQKQINWVINGLWMLSPKTMRARLSEGKYNARVGRV